MRKSFVSVVALLIVLSAAGIAFAQATAPAPTAPGVAAIVKGMVDRAKAEAKKATIAEVKEAIDKKEKVVILDVRDKDEYDTGRFPGAINVSRGKLEFRIAAAIPDLNAKIYVYCLSAARSSLASKTLVDLGYKNVILVDAPFDAWVKAGYPVEK